MSNYCYLRVSSDAQNVQNQKMSVMEYANKRGWSVEYCEDVITSKKSWRERKIGELINKAVEGDRLIFAEISRAGRSTLEVVEMFEILATKKVEIHSVKEGINFEFDSEVKKSMSTMIVACFASVAQIERAFIGARSKEAINRLKAEAAAKGETYKSPKTGKGIGRPKGEQELLKLDARREEIDKLLSVNVGLSSIAKIVGASRPTIYRWAKRRKINIKVSPPTPLPIHKSAGADSDLKKSKTI